jgi:hypothetical protein
MKYNFKQIVALGTSALLIGMTAGLAAAANYPAPFVVGGTANVAIVYGTGSGVSSLDLVQAGNIQEDLGVGGTSISVEGGEAFALDKSSNHFNFNNALNAIYTSLDDDEMTFLADGDYDEGDIDTDYEHSITLGSKTLALFADPDYKDDAPTIGLWWTNAETILSYTIDFEDNVNYTLMVDTDMPLLGSEYYVLAAASTQIDILDTAEKTQLAVGETATVGGKSVTLTYVDTDSAKFTVDGEATDDLAKSDPFKLADDSYIVVTDLSYQDYAGGIQAAEFAIGSGKIELINGEEAELNTEDIDGLEVTLTTTSDLLDSLTLTWKSDRDSFLTETNSLSLPEFGVIQLAFGGLDLPASPETIAIQNGDELTISMDNYDIPVVWYNGTAAFLGEEDRLLVVATSVQNYTTPAVNLTGGINLEENNRFIVTSIGEDLSDVETLYYEVNSIENNSGTIEVELDDLIGTKDLTFDDIESDDVGAVTVTLVAVNGTISGQAYLNFSTSVSGAYIYYNRVVSDKGLVISFPTTASDYTGSGGTLTLYEADKEENLAGGTYFAATAKNTSNDKLHISTYDYATNTSREEESDDNYIGYVKSDLASKILFDTSADEYDFSVVYYGEEVTADVQVIAGGEVTSEAVGGVLVKDTEVSSVSSKNLIVVGGSCINSVAANLIGGAYCGSGWTDETDVGSGQFLIQSFGDAYTTGKIALLVAGYDVADTVNAATYLRTQTVDTTAGKKYIGTTATQATLQVE